jgi:hypothetical protein
LTYAETHVAKKRDGNGMLSSKRKKKIRSNNPMGKEGLQHILQQLLDPIHSQLQQQTTMLQTLQQKLSDLEKQLLPNSTGSLAATTASSPVNIDSTNSCKEDENILQEQAVEEPTTSDNGGDDAVATDQEATIVTKDAP